MHRGARRLGLFVPSPPQGNSPPLPAGRRRVPRHFYSVPKSQTRISAIARRPTMSSPIIVVGTTPTSKTGKTGFDRRYAAFTAAGQHQEAKLLLARFTASFYKNTDVPVGWPMSLKAAVAFAEAKCVRRRRRPPLSTDNRAPYHVHPVAPPYPNPNSTYPAQIKRHCAAIRESVGKRFFAAPW